MKFRLPIIALISGLVTVSSAFAQDGAEIFKTRCTACHSIGKGTVVGPDLKNVHKKYDEKWISEWIRSSQKKVNAGDPKALEIFNKFNKIPMPDQDINDAELKALLTYIGNESEHPAPAPVAVVTPEPKSGPASTEEKSMDAGTVFLYIGISMIAVFFLGIVWVLGLVIKKLSKSLEMSYAENKKSGKQVSSKEMERV